ncbi:hypothetical protein D5086_019648 [Populus alba]|uniref:Uncharacterized protein n=1 Tax=Populus alba TaxID=43335 RepID=A0ACC4BHV4_POPAL
MDRRINLHTCIQSLARLLLVLGMDHWRFINYYLLHDEPKTPYCPASNFHLHFRTTSKILLGCRSRLAAAPLTVVDLSRDRQTVISSGCTRYLTLLVRVFLHAKPGIDATINTKRGDGEAAGKDSVKHQKTQRVLDGRLNAANDVAKERNVEEESFNNESNAAKRKRSRRENESKKDGNEEEMRVLGKNSISSVNSAKNKNRASNPNMKLRKCERQYEERQRTRREKEHGRGRGSSNEGSRQHEEQQRSQNGHFRVLERLSKKSELLRGLENYRFEIVEANPNTFVIPHHCDSDAVLFVLRGKGTMTFVSQWKRESYSLERGDVMKVQAGVVGYLINPDDNEKLKALSQHASSSKHKRSHEGKEPINLLNQRRPLSSNKFGKFFEVSPNDYKQLRDADISIGLADKS